MSSNYPSRAPGGGGGPRVMQDSANTISQYDYGSPPPPPVSFGNQGQVGGGNPPISPSMGSGNPYKEGCYPQDPMPPVNPSEVVDSEGSCAGSCMACFATFMSALLIIITFPLTIWFCFKVIREYERAVIFRMGRLRSGELILLVPGARGPGTFFILPCIDDYRCVDLRSAFYDIPPQEVLTQDSVTVSVDAVIYYRVFNPVIAVSNVADYRNATLLLAATTLRNVLGTKTLAEILTDRESIAVSLQTSLDEATDPWGVKVERVEMKDVRMPQELQRAMAAEAEASREARAKVIAAEGEMNASKALKEAADIMVASPGALQLRYLQTLGTIAAEKNSTIIFPLPIDLLTPFLRR